VIVTSLLILFREIFGKKCFELGVRVKIWKDSYLLQYKFIESLFLENLIGMRNSSSMCRHTCVGTLHQ